MSISFLTSNKRGEFFFLFYLTYVPNVVFLRALALVRHELGIGLSGKESSFCSLGEICLQ